jgi:transcription initiation factor IIE alpha subunit
MSIEKIKTLFIENNELTLKQAKEKTNFSLSYVNRILNLLVNRNFLTYEVKRMYEKRIPTKIYKLKRK